MRTIQRILAGFASLVLLASCGSPKEQAPESVTASFTVLLVTGGENRGLLVSGSSGEPASLSLGDLAITAPDGGSFDFESLRPGHILDLTWDGMFLSTYPAQIHNVAAVSVTGEQPEDWTNPIDGDPFFDSWRQSAKDSPYGGMPALQVEYRTDTVAACLNAARGTSSWYENGTAICANSPAPTQWNQELIPVITRSAALDLTLRFSREPDTFTLRRWTWDQLGTSDEGEPVELQDHTLPVPAKGEFLYEVAAGWEQGNVTYVFAVREKTAAASVSDYAISVSGQVLDLSAIPLAPYPENGTVMVPLRPIAEALGYTVAVDPENAAVTVDDDYIQMAVLTGGSPEAVFTGHLSVINMSRTVETAVPTAFYDGEPYVPLEFFREFLNDTAVEGTLLTVAPSTCELDA